jgi:glycosyltransferase involved in cell wall biosynthesis
MRVGHVELPENVRVYSVGKETGYSEPRRALEFYRHLFRVLREDRVDVCFSHMMPLFTVLAAPALKWDRIPIVTWYAHPSLSWTLKIAHRLSDRMVTSIAPSYPYKHDKLVVVGHGIDSHMFSPDGGVSPEHTDIILCVGRLSPIKNHPTLLKAARLLRQVWSKPFRVVIVGGPALSSDESYVRLLHKQVKELELEKTVYFEPPTRGERLLFWYRISAVHVNLTPKGFVDKVALEAMACARPSLVANEGFRETLGEYASRLLFRYADADALADKLIGLLALPKTHRDRIGLYLRQQVERKHSLDRLAGELIGVFQSVNER